MLKNLAALGLGNLEHASSIARFNRLQKDDYRGIIVTMIHKFRDMPADLNTRPNIYVLIDEAHRKFRHLYTNMYSNWVFVERNVFACKRPCLRPIRPFKRHKKHFYVA